MTPINLIDYTHSSKKIPSAFLRHNPVQATEIKLAKILAAYFLDFVAITTGAVMFSSILKVSFNGLMITSSMERAFDNIPFASLTFNLLPFIFMSYFFFSFFFNHGQTWGMNVMKYRITMKKMSFKSSLVWAMFSSVFMMTGGLSFLFTYNKMKNKNWGEFKGHDHLYSELMQERFFTPISLVEHTNNLAKAETAATKEEFFVKAA
jgi:hypothetical protein